MKPRVLLDMDGVIVNFYKGFSKHLNKNYGCTLDTNVEPEEYPFEKWGHGVDRVNFDTASKEWIEKDGFEKLPAFDGATEFVKELMSLCNVFIVTARIGDWSQKFTPETRDRIKDNTRNWLKENDIPSDNLFFSHEKIPFCKENAISIMIEDKPSTAMEASKNKIHTILINRAKNRSQFPRYMIYKVSSLDEVLEQLRKLIK